MKTGGRAIAVGLLAACALVGFSAAFALAAGADSGPVQSTTTTPEPPPPTEPPPTTPPPETTPPPRQLGIPGGVSVGHVDVGGLLPYQAADVMRKAFARPLVLVTPTGKVRVAPAALGASRRSRRRSAARASRGREQSCPLDVEVSP